jgi:hypothetical protein
MTPEIDRLQRCVDTHLGLDFNPSRLGDGRRKLVEQGLFGFDATYLARLTDEARRLSAGDGLASDAAIPAFFLRTVIREALSKVNAAEFVESRAVPFGPTIVVAYSYRDTTAAGVGNTRVYEGQEIPRAGIRQSTDLTYPIPQKLAFAVSDELRHMSLARAIEFDPVRENLSNASRIIGEDLNRLIFNEMLLSSDEYGATPVSGEDLQLQADGTKRVFVLQHFPVVRPRRVYDLQGTLVGSEINPITVTYNSVELEEYDGTGTQPVGTYFVLNYNLGEIYLVDESGTIQTPSSLASYEVSYSYATNCYAFDIDPAGSSTFAEHLDQFLYRFALRKTALESRCYPPDFALMSGNLMTAVEQAKGFSENFKRPGTHLDEGGSVGRIKDVPVWTVRGPGVLFRDERVLLGQKGTTRFFLLKPWEMSRLINERGPNGRFTGKKEAYGDQFVAIHTPGPLKAAYTSLVVYSGSARVARVDP